MSPIKNVIYHASHTEFRRFFWAGSFAFLVDFSVLYVLTEVLEINYLWSNLFAVSLGIIVSYVLCITWVFNERRYNHVAFEFQLFVLLSIIGLALNESLLWTLVEFVNVHYLTAKVIVTLAIFVVNFFLKKIVLFRR